MYPIIDITDSIEIPVYLLIISLVYCFCIFWLLKRVQKFQLQQNDALDLALAIMIGGLVGARLFHVIYEDPQYYMQKPLEIFKIWKGGYVFYGGALLAFASALIVVKIKKLNYFTWSDVFAPIIPVGYAFGRLACFFNGCCYGQKCDLPWGVQFPHLELGARHPTQIYAFFLEILLFIIILKLDHIRFSQDSSKFTSQFYQKHLAFLLSPTGQLFNLFLVGHGINRIIVESFRDDFRGQFIFGLSISTLISVGIILTGAHFLYHRRIKLK